MSPKYFTPSEVDDWGSREFTVFLHQWLYAAADVGKRSKMSKMNPGNPASSHDFSTKTIAITGGGGVLRGVMAKALAACHAKNRFLLTEKGTGALTARGNEIIEHKPMARFGTPDDLVGATLWLLSPASAFVTGIVVPIDGGFPAKSGV